MILHWLKVIIFIKMIKIDSYNSNQKLDISKSHTWPRCPTLVELDIRVVTYLRCYFINRLHVLVILG